MPSRTGLNTGPEHYARAEELLAGRHNGGANGARSPEEAIALAGVHATLALAAATALDAMGGGGDAASHWAREVVVPTEDTNEDSKARSTQA